MKHLYYSTTLCYCQTLSLHEYLSKCLKKWHLNIVVLFSPYDNSKCTKTEQGFRTCNILQTAPHRVWGIPEFNNNLATRGDRTSASSTTIQWRFGTWRKVLPTRVKSAFCVGLLWVGLMTYIKGKSGVSMEDKWSMSITAPARRMQAGTRVENFVIIPYVWWSV